MGQKVGLQLGGEAEAQPLEGGQLLVHRHRRAAELGGEKTGKVVEIHKYPSFLRG